MNTLTVNGCDYQFIHENDNNVDQVAVIDHTHELLGVLSIDHKAQSATYEDGAKKSNVNYVEFKTMDQLALAKWIVYMSIYEEIFRKILNEAP